MNKRNYAIATVFLLTIVAGLYYFYYWKNKPENLYKSFVNKYPESGLTYFDDGSKENSIFFAIQNASFYLLSIDQHQAAKRMIKSVLKHYPDNPIALNNRAGIEAVNGKYEKALIYLEKAKENEGFHKVLNIRYLFVVNGAVFNFLHSTKGETCDVEIMDVKNRFFANGTGALGLIKGTFPGEHLEIESLIDYNIESVERMIEN